MEEFQPLLVMVQPWFEIRSMLSRFKSLLLLVCWPHFMERNIAFEGQEGKSTRSDMILSHRTLPWKRTDCNSYHYLPYCFMQGFCQWSITLIVKKGCSDRASRVPIVSGSVTGYRTEYSSVFCTPSLQKFIYIDKTPPSLLFFTLNSPRSLGPFLDPAVSLYLFCTGLPRTGHSTPSVSHQCWVEGKDKLPWPTGNTPIVAQTNDSGSLIDNPCCRVLKIWVNFHEKVKMMTWKQMFLVFFITE